MAIVLPVLYEAMSDIKKKWQTRRGGLVLLGALAHRAPASVAEAVPAIIPIVSECMRDVRKEVVTTAEEVRRGRAHPSCCAVITAPAAGAASAAQVMFAVAGVVGNKDIEPFIPALISAISRPKEVPECVHQLSATTFVQQVDAATLAVIVPVLTLGLREPAAAIKRKVRACLACVHSSSHIRPPPTAAACPPYLRPIHAYRPSSSSRTCASSLASPSTLSPSCRCSPRAWRRS
jgi:elongation factor 3